jgi:hypothetical protein
MINNVINDFTPETKSLIKALTAAGFIITGGNNGEERFDFGTDLAKFLDNLLATDETRLYVESPKGKKLSLFLVLGNSPGELVADYSICGDVDELEAVTQAHYDKWEGRKQPKTTWEARYGKAKS